MTKTVFLRVGSGLLLLPWLPTALGQEQPASKFKVHTKLVQVPVIVTDKQGKPVPNLSRADFRLYENGKPVTIATFDSFSTSRSAAIPEEDPGTRTFSNAPKTASSEPVVIIAIDALNTTFLDQGQARRQLVKFLSEQIGPGSMVSLVVFTRSGLRVIHEFSTGSNVLIAALNRAKVADAGGSAPAEATDSVVDKEATLLRDFVVSGEEFVDLRRAGNLDILIQCLRKVGQSVAGVPGRKTLIWMASAFPYFRDDPTALTSTDIGGRFFQVLEELNNVNVAIYPIDAGGLIGYQPATILNARNPGGVSPSVGSRQVLSGSGDTSLGTIMNVTPVDAMKAIAELTAGVPYYGTNDLRGAMRKAVDDSRTHYILGYYARADGNKAVKRKLKVEVPKGDLTVRSRNTVFIGLQPPSPSSELLEALRSPVELTALPVRVVFGAPGTETGFEVAVAGDAIEVSPDEAIKVRFVVESRTSDGRELERIDETLSGRVRDVSQFRQRPLKYSNRFRRAQGAATFTIVVRDEHSGRMGSVVVDAQRVN